MEDSEVFDCSVDLLAFHNDEITLPRAEQTNMRERRDANRERLKKGLKEKSKPTPREFASQGSYAMKTMVQHPDNDYDIDDGCYFDKEVLVGDRGAEMSALQVRQMARDALDDGSFKTPPEVRKNCVRVYYVAGYCVDVPVYRRITTKDAFGRETFYHELASSDWKRSDAREVTTWFEDQNAKQSPDTESGRQLRRIVRHIKKYSRSRTSWSDQILCGFGITKLVTECFLGDKIREDRALYETMKAIRDRLSASLVIDHPVTPNETITKGTDDAGARYLRERLTDGLETLAPLFEVNCNRTKALKSWDKFYSTSFFGDRDATKMETKSSLLRAVSVAPPSGAFTFPNAPRVDAKPRGFG